MLHENEPKNSLKREASLLAVCKMANLVVTMLATMLLSRFRTLDEYGTYSQILSVITLVTTLLLLGIPNAINYFYPRFDTDIERRDFLQTFFGINTIMSIIAGFLMVTCVPLFVFYFKNNSIWDFVYLFALLPWAQITIQERSNLFVASHKTKVLVTYIILNSAALLGIVILTQAINQTFQFYMALYVIVETIFAITVYYEARKLTGKLALKLNINLLKNIFRYSIPIGFSDMVNQISREIDKLMIGGFLGTESFAIYTNAGKELALTVISTSFIAVLLPEMSRLIKDKKMNEAIDIWKNTTSFTYIFMSFGVAALIVFAPQVMTILYSEKYLPGTDVFRIYALILLWRTTYFGSILNLNGKTKQILVCSVLALVINVILNYFLFILIGFNGPAWSTFISIGIVDLLQLRMSSKLTNIPFSKIFPWKDLFKTSVINIIFAITVYLIIRFAGISTDILSCILSVIIGMVWMAVYFGIIMRKKVFRKY